MGKLIILRGNSGSGKTTVAKELQKKFGYNTMLISQDEIFQRELQPFRQCIIVRSRRSCLRKLQILKSI